VNHATEPPPAGNPLLLLWDGHAYAYRAFHAIRSLNAPDGRPTNAIYGFAKMLTKTVATLRPAHVAVVWDGGLAAERMVLLPEYKAQRPSMPEGLEAQLPAIQELVTALGFTGLVQDGVEADDWIAALALAAERASLPVVIASADKDFLQLVRDGIRLLNPNDKTDRLWTSADVSAKTGVTPERIVDWLSLMGDAVDNIPGAPGIGPKTAADLLNRFGSLDVLYARLEEVTPERVRETLRASSGAVFRNREMVRLRGDLAPAVELETLRRRPPDVERLRAIYSACGFRTMLAELQPAAPVQGGLFG
jgi:DNA polymerase I